MFRDFYECPRCDGLLPLREAIKGLRDPEWTCPRCGQKLPTDDEREAVMEAKEARWAAEAATEMLT